MTFLSLLDGNNTVTDWPPQQQISLLTLQSREAWEAFSHVPSNPDFGPRLQPLMLLRSQKQNDFPAHHGVMAPKPADVGGFTKSPKYVLGQISLDLTLQTNPRSDKKSLQGKETGAKEPWSCGSVS